MTSIDLASLVETLGPKCAEGADGRDHSAAFVDGNYELLRRHKVFSALVPQDVGGGGARHSEMCTFLRGLARHCCSTALAVSMHQHLVAAAVVNARNGGPGGALLQKVAADETILVATGANDWVESSGSMTRAEGGYMFTARKPFASGSPRGDLLVTSGPYEDPDQGAQVLHFAVPMSSDGLSSARDWDTLGMRATGSHTVVLENVFVPDAAVVLKRPRGEYHPVWSTILTVALPLIMSVYCGAAEKAAEIAAELAARRTDDPAAPYFLGELTNRLTEVQLAVDDMVRITNDLDVTANVETANAMLIRKTLAANAAIGTVEKALEISGGAGFYRKSGLERLLRDVHAGQFHPLQEKRQHDFTGRLALGLDPIVPPAARKFAAAAE